VKPSRRHGAVCRMASKRANLTTTPNVNAFTYIVRLHQYNAGVRSTHSSQSRATVMATLARIEIGSLRDGYGMTAEQMIFERPCGPDVSIFLIDGRVVTKKAGRSCPADILGFALPLAPDPADNAIDDVAGGPPAKRPSRHEGEQIAGTVRSLKAANGLHLQATACRIPHLRDEPQQIVRTLHVHRWRSDRVRGRRTYATEPGSRRPMTSEWPANAAGPPTQPWRTKNGPDLPPQGCPRG
jgi:hypothetical protein